MGYLHYLEIKFWLNTFYNIEIRDKKEQSVFFILLRFATYVMINKIIFQKYEEEIL
jgi:hypothetical protein